MMDELREGRPYLDMKKLTQDRHAWCEQLLVIERHHERENIGLSIKVTAGASRMLIGWKVHQTLVITASLHSFYR